MQVTLKQSEVTAAIAAYLTNVLGVKNVSPETLSVVYKQGRSDKNGMTAELEIEAPAYVKPTESVTEEAGTQTTGTAIIEALLAPIAGEVGNVQPSAEIQPETTSASGAVAPEHAPVEAVAEAEQVVDTTTVYDGERREEQSETVVEQEAQAPVTDEVAQALAEDAAAEAGEEAEPAAVSAPLFG